MLVLHYDWTIQHYAVHNSICSRRGLRQHKTNIKQKDAIEVISSIVTMPQVFNNRENTRIVSTHT